MRLGRPVRRSWRAWWVSRERSRWRSSASRARRRATASASPSVGSRLAAVGIGEVERALGARRISGGDRDYPATRQAVPAGVGLCPAVVGGDVLDDGEPESGFVVRRRSAARSGGGRPRTVADDEDGRVLVLGRLEGRGRVAGPSVGRGNGDDASGRGEHLLQELDDAHERSGEVVLAGDRLEHVAFAGEQHLLALVGGEHLVDEGSAGDRTGGGGGEGLEGGQVGVGGPREALGVEHAEHADAAGVDVERRAEALASNQRAAASASGSSPGASTAGHGQRRRQLPDCLPAVVPAGQYQVPT